MATINASGTPLPVLLFSAAFFLSAVLPLSAQPSPPVLDTDGDEVRIGSLYRIIQGGFGFAGGLTKLPPVIKPGCAKPVGPGQEVDPGLPVWFEPGWAAEAEDGILRLGVRSKFTFQVSSHTPCADPGVWTGSEANSTFDGPFTAVVAGQEPGGPRSQKWFEVRETDTAGVYTLAYCWCLPCKIFCPDIALYTVSGESVLGAGVQEGGEAYRVLFVKHQPITGAATTSATS